MTRAQAQRSAHVREVLRRVKYRDGWKCHTLRAHGLQTLWWTFMAPDSDDPHGPHHQMTGRRWIVEDHASDAEVIQTALAAMLTAEEHENREHFRVDGRPVYGPHAHEHAGVPA